MQNRYELCVDADAFVTALRAALPRCRERLLVQFSTFEGDAAGAELAELLLERAAHGVEVRMLLDCYSDIIVDDIYPIALHRRGAATKERDRTRALLERLAAGGVAIKRTAPPGFLGRFLLYRDHKKMVVLDDGVAFVGGINISEHNYAWHDFMVRIDGPLAAELGAEHTSTWAGSTVVLDQSRTDADYLINQCAGRGSIVDEVLRLVDGAERRVVFESPYLLGDRIETAILGAARRGVAVTIVLPWRANHFHSRLWVRKLLRRFRHPNIRCYGYQERGGMTHAKLLIVDDRIATFGSLNFLELEALTQKELNVFTRDPAIIGSLNELVDRDVAASELLPVPRSGFGRFTYGVLHGFFGWWTGRLVRDREWRSRYC